MNAKLLTVELALLGEEFVLTEKDADILVQVRSNSVMWHKERLINIGIERLPASVTYVAWVDCDIVFEDNDWQEQAVRLLKEVPMIQLFKNLFDLGKFELPEICDVNSKLPSGYSFASHQNDKAVYLGTPANYQAFRFNACGIAWAARVSFIKKHYLYDVMILGSGDRMLAAAAIGQFEQAIITTHLKGARAEHYLSWAKPFYSDICGSISYLPGSAFHLWHGDLQNRGWTDRHRKLDEHHFDPSVDLRYNQMKCWEWSGNNKPLHEYIQNYFADRKEDG
ncbi:hypothetical protein [Mucilaginibacter defluvii]|uniref:hypothetical protein n=1 Tax=Mucilaginibacter defluvii TaxID=1196019 RepID=UPI0031EC3516